MLGDSTDRSETIHSLEGHTSTVRCIKVLDRRPIAVTGSRDFTLRVWDINRGQLLRTLEGHEQSVRCIEVAGNKVVSGSYDFTCKVRAAEDLGLDMCSGKLMHSSGMSIQESACIPCEGTITRSMRWRLTGIASLRAVWTRPCGYGTPRRGEWCLT